MKRIFIPVDFSEYSLNACEYAVHFAAGFEAAQITLFHAYHVPVVDPLIPQQYLVDLANSAREGAEGDLKRLADRVEENFSAEQFKHIEIKQIATMGFAADEILAASKSIDPDYIIMGTRNADSRKILLGSVTSAIIEKAHFPVLIVPEHVSYKGPITDVLYASDLNEADVKSINKLLELTVPMHAKVHCVHVSLDTEKDEKQQQFRELEKAFREDEKLEYIDFESTQADDVIHGINDYIQSHNIGLMAMLTHERSFFLRLFDRSLTKKLAIRTNVPLIAFHA